MNHLLHITKKELLGVLRERRVLFTTVVLPILIMPLVMYGPLLFLGNAAKRTQEDVQKVGTVNVPEAVLALLRANKLEPVPTTNPQAQVQNREIQAALVFSGEYTLYGRLSGATQSALVVEKVKDALRQYKDLQVAQSLRAKGVDIRVLEPFRVVTRDASREQERSAGIFAFLIPYFLMLFIQVGGLPVAVDATAGEKEKGTLEALLAAPITLWFSGALSVAGCHGGGFSRATPRGKLSPPVAASTSRTGGCPAFLRPFRLCGRGYYG
jgi:sodium transport system permease protein